MPDCAAPLRSLLAACLCGLFATVLRAQPVTTLNTIDVSAIRLSAKLKDKVLWYCTNTHAIADEQIATLPFRDTIPLSVRKKILRRLVQQEVYLKFTTENKDDTTIVCYFLPGYFYETIDVFRLPANTGRFEKLPAKSNDPMGFRSIEIPPRETVSFFVHLQFVKTSVNTLNPELIRDYYLDSFTASKKAEAEHLNIITFVFSGILLMMILYSIAVAFRNRSREFLLYACYSFCLGLMLFLKSFLFRSPSSFYYFFEGYLDFVLQSFGTFLYLFFLQTFINAKKDFPPLYKLFQTEQVFILASLLMFSYYYFFTDNYVFQDNVENWSKYIWSACALIFIIYALRQHKKLLTYLALGHTILLVCGLISLYLIIAPAGVKNRFPDLLQNALVYYELGLAGELVLFLVALAYKNKEDIVQRTQEEGRLRLLTEKKDFEQKLAVVSAQQHERNRISADMHDELGSGATAIRLASEVLKNKMKGSTFPELDKISRNADELINKMNALIWTMKSENDTLESLAMYIRIYALEFFDNTDIDCVVDIPGALENIEITGGRRRNVFLCVKESLNNVLKHSLAQKVVISFSVDQHIMITIEDDGVGIDFGKLRPFSSGLTNMSKRMSSIEGRFRIENAPGKGVKTTIELWLPGSKHVDNYAQSMNQ